ncbi:YpmA family protein [Bacillus luteus]|uniref:YpmA family protein n=1 Tax=Alkalicoccus luteus TaxID=1237094 RepID=A0A969TUN7_9BACI|nr:YpmA family protein [Alkalicoccus luteus]
MSSNQVKLLNSVTINKCPDAYKMVDSLNRTLKERDLMFGIALDEKDSSQMVFTIYDTAGE